MFRDYVSAVAHHRKVSGQAIEAQNEAAEIKVRAERRIGELLREMPKHRGGNPSLTGDSVSPVATLDSIGIHKKQSERFQAIASIPEETFEAPSPTPPECPTTSYGTRTVSDAVCVRRWLPACQGNAVPWMWRLLDLLGTLDLLAG